MSSTGITDSPSYRRSFLCTTEISRYGGRSQVEVKVLRRSSRAVCGNEKGALGRLFHLSLQQQL